jgi:ADP-ribose pyrophosphatase YjhB (NUDIX family)
MAFVGCDGVVIEDGRILLQQREDFRTWGVPGGAVEPAETPWEACLREVREETGLEVRVERLTGVYAKPHQDELVFNFDCVTRGGRLQATAEADQACYFPLTALPDSLLPRQRERIMDASAGLARPVVKRQGADWVGDSDRKVES